MAVVSVCYSLSCSIKDRISEALAAKSGKPVLILKNKLLGGHELGLERRRCSIGDDLGHSILLQLLHNRGCDAGAYGVIESGLLQISALGVLHIKFLAVIPGNPFILNVIIVHKVSRIVAPVAVIIDNAHFIDHCAGELFKVPAEGASPCFGEDLGELFGKIVAALSNALIAHNLHGIGYTIGKHIASLYHVTDFGSHRAGYRGVHSGVAHSDEVPSLGGLSDLGHSAVHGGENSSTREHLGGKEHALHGIKALRLVRAIDVFVLNTAHTRSMLGIMRNCLIFKKV